MKQVTQRDVPFLIFENMSGIPWLRHGFSTKLGGVSEGCYESMNLGQKRSDVPENVAENYCLITQAIGLEYEDLVVSNQVHETEVKLVTQADRGKGIFHTPEPCDALITRETKIALTTQYADCVPIFYADTKTRAIGLAHAGWKGTVKGIAGITVEHMVKHFGSKPEDILVGIAPSIKQCCFEVDEDVALAFTQTYPWSAEFIVPKENKFNINLQAINAKILTDSGVPVQNIEISQYCTMCREDLFFSHRRDGNNRGAMAAFMGLVS